ncbi:COR domain-containing protein [Kordia sp.]|uniref:COR domain-containing protein n=1 Tax=Kordia sp. TaxID=1965332 RepID=UPI003D6C1BC3
MEEVHDIDYARKLIKKNLATKNTFLDLGNCGLTDLSKLIELFECVHLETLILSNHYMLNKEYKKSINNGQHNKIHSIPSIFSKLKYLKILKLANNKLRNTIFLKNSTKLEDLDIKFNNINDITYLTNLTNLKQFDIDGITYTNLNNLKYFTKLKSLTLGHSRVSNYNSLKHCIQLEELEISWVRIENTSFLNELIHLKKLILEDCSISNIDFIKNLSNLKHLNLNSNKIKNVDILKEFKKLKTLNLSNNVDIDDYSSLSKLKNLTDISLEMSSVKNYDFLSELFLLEKLNLGHSMIKDITFLESLKELRELDLSFNDLKNVSILKNLKKIEKLDISNNEIDNFQFLESLKNLYSLNISFSDISDFTFLSNIKKVKKLFLSHSNIKNINFLSQLKNLSILHLDHNEIKDVNPISGLTSLKNLRINNNQIEKIPLSLFNNLKTYNISNDFFPNKDLNISGNPIQSPPLEILEQGREATLAWYEANKVKLDEIKVILIGDPKAGKTSLLRKLKDNSFTESEVQTDGINIESLKFGKLETFKKQTALHELTGHFWDFGGQEIMNATHQFFLTKRCVYVLVIDARKDTSVSEQIRKWVNKIKTTGGNSSIIIISNKIDVNSGFGFENEYDLQQEFSQIKYFIKTSSKTEQGIEELKDKLAELIPQSELFNTEIDERWIPIKEQLQEETKQNDKLNEARFIEICQQHGLTKKFERQSAISFLNDLGIVLHFEDINLAEYYVLDPYWITYGIYQIVTSKFAGDQKGKIAMDELDFIINEEEDKETVYRPSNYKRIEYSTNERRFLIHILQQFKLSFMLRDNCHFILPDLLDTNEPKKLTVPIREATETIQFVYEYAYLPKAIMPYIMVETHEIMTANWRTGCILQNLECKALVRTYKNQLRIIVSGKKVQKREFMSVIRYVIDSFNKKLSNPPAMLIPLPNNYGFVYYEELIGREQFGESDYNIFKNKTVIQIKIKKLLDGISSKEELNKSAESKLNQIIQNQEKMMESLYSNTEFLYQKLDSPNLEYELQKVIFEMNQEQQFEISTEITTKLTEAFTKFDAEIDKKFKTIYNNLQKSDHADVKLKLGIPLISLLGVQLESEYNVKNWFKEMSEKYNLKVLNPFF